MPSTRFRPSVLALIAGVALVLGGCGSDSSDTAASASVIADSTIVESTIVPDDPTTAVPDSSADSSAATSTATTTAATMVEGPDLAAPIPLTANSVGDVKLGDEAEVALARLVELFGPPASDSGWGEQQSPCDNMGSRSRFVSWNTFSAFLATGPTEYIDRPGDHLSAYYVFDTGFADGPGPDPARFTLSDGAAALGRTISDLQAWNPSVQRFLSEIEGPIWTTGGGPNQLSGALASDSDGEPERSGTVRGGLFCID